MRIAALWTSLLGLAVLLAGCEDPFAPTLQPVPSEATTTTLFEFQDSELRDPSAFDVIGRRPIRTDQSSGWDFLVAASGDGLEFRPRGLVLDGESTAGLQRFDGTFEDLDVAPENGYVTDEALDVEEGAVYVARSRRDPSLGVSCLRYLKLEVVSLEPGAGSVTFRHIGNPNCGRRTLIAGATGDEQDE